jgi:hypothetical protein
MLVASRPWLSQEWSAQNMSPLMASWSQGWEGGGECLYLVSWGGVRLMSPLGLLYQPRMIDDDECGAVGGMRIGRGNWSTQRKPAPVPLCTPQITHGLTRVRTLAAVMGNRQITAWAWRGFEWRYSYTSIISLATAKTRCRENLFEGEIFRDKLQTLGFVSIHYYYTLLTYYIILGLQDKMTSPLLVLGRYPQNIVIFFCYNSWFHWQCSAATVASPMTSCLSDLWKLGVGSLNFLNLMKSRPA